MYLRWNQPMKFVNESALLFSKRLLTTSPSVPSQFPFLHLSCTHIFLHRSHKPPTIESYSKIHAPWYKRFSRMHKTQIANWQVNHVLCTPIMITHYFVFLQMYQELAIYCTTLLEGPKPHPTVEAIWWTSSSSGRMLEFVEHRANKSWAGFLIWIHVLVMSEFSVNVEQKQWIVCAGMLLDTNSVMLRLTAIRALLSPFPTRVDGEEIFSSIHRCLPFKSGCTQ